METENKIAYLCNGLNPKCSGKIGCYKCSIPEFDPLMTCRHTLDVKYAVNGPCEDPEREVPNRFKRFVDHDGKTIRYFEEIEDEGN